MGEPAGNGTARPLRRASPWGRGSVFAGAPERVDGAVVADVLGEDGADALGGHLAVVDLVLPAHELEVLLPEGIRWTGAILADNDVRAEVAEAVAAAPGERAPAAEVEVLDRLLCRGSDALGAVATAIRSLADGHAVGGHAEISLTATGL